MSKIRAVARPQFGNPFAALDGDPQVCPKLVESSSSRVGRRTTGLREDLLETVSGSELQLGDELHVARAPVAEIWIKRIRRAGQTEARTESR